jgi:hypothetical protein
MKQWTRGIIFLNAALVLCVAGCANDSPKITATFNQGASVAGELPINPLTWRVVSSAIDPTSGTMSTLYGNDSAIAHARAHFQHDYPAGSALSLVTWTQMEDSRWFGANIPSQVKSVEFVTVTAAENGAPQYSYEAYTGSPLKKTQPGPYGAPPDRIALLLSTRAAVMP